ncbi:MAG: aldose 1-epimerase family protein [Microcella sp.]|nr:aldose 1-epimerase family protein [Microcella sp.]
MTPTTNFFGRSRGEAERRMGALHQVARIDRFIEDDGPARGARRVRMVTGGGLEVEIHPDRALDLGQVTYRGVPLAWISPVGMSSPALADSRGNEWLRSFGGGLLATCGLDTFGPPTIDDGVEYPQHGRVGVTPATVTRTEIVGEQLIVSGSVRQTTVFGENLLLNRTWSADLGGSTLRLTDVVRNDGLADAGHMVLYHVNVGWPLLDESAVLDVGSREVTPRDEDARAGAGRWHQIEPPHDGYREQVFGHDFRDHGMATVSIDNPTLNVRLELAFDSATLPAMHQWKMSGEGHYVMGLEPVNVNTFAGRAGAAAAGVLPTLRRGRDTTYSLELRLGPSRQGGAR